MKTFAPTLFCFLFTLCGVASDAQNSTVDSVVSHISNLPDTVIAETLLDSSLEYRFADFDLSYAYAQKSLVYSIRAKNGRLIGNGYNFSGIAQQLMTHYPEALKNYTMAESTFRNYGLKKGLASTYINIGVLNQDLGNLKNSIEYNRKAYGISLSVGDSVNASSALNNIATLQSDLNNLDSALYYNFKALEIRQKLKMNRLLSTTLSNIGVDYDAMKKYDLAVKYQKMAVALDSASLNKKSLSISLSNLGATLTKMNRNAEAKKVLLRAMEISNEIQAKDIQLDIYANLIPVLDSLGELKDAITYSQLYINLKDSLTDADNRDALAEMQAQLDNSVQKNEIEILNKNKLIDDEKARRLNTIIYFGAGTIFLFLVLLIIIFRGYNQKKKANIIITEQKKEVEIQKEIIEEKNKDILDSIHYAKRIQKSLLPTELYIEKNIGRLKKN